MTWKDFLAGLDKVRSEIRAEHGKELDKQVDFSEPKFAWLWAAMNGAPLPKEPEPQKPILDDALFATLPEEEGIPRRRIQDVVYRGDGEGRMVVMARETPFVLREPDLVEVTEEELSK